MVHPSEIVLDSCGTFQYAQFARENWHAGIIFRLDRFLVLSNCGAANFGGSRPFEAALWKGDQRRLKPTFHTDS
jgi:hypothetical protein